MKLHSDERGIAMILTLFMVMVVSVLSASLMFVSQTETLSSRNYRTTSQARYAAESGIHKTAHHLLYEYAAPGTPSDPLASYDMTKSPVEFDGKPVVLSSDPDVPSNYPVADVEAAFVAATKGALDVTNGSVGYATSATLLSMQQITDNYSLQPVTVQTWQLNGAGIVGGVSATKVEVLAVVERQVGPVFAYAAFATYRGCAALSFSGGGTTDSYVSDPSSPGVVPTLDNTGGNVGTNGNLSQVGSTTVINGSLSTPRAGVGNCTSNNVTAQTIKGNASVTEGLVELSQPVTYPTPTVPDVPPPILPLPILLDTTWTAANCPCGDVTVSGGSTLELTGAGPGTTTTYLVNSLTLTGNSTIKVAPNTGNVVIQIAGKDGGGEYMDKPLWFTGNGDTISNSTYDPSTLQFVYAGDADIQVSGNSDAAALIYAPNASGTLIGGADFYGAAIFNKLDNAGGTAIHYDRRLQTEALYAGNFTMSAFSWKSY